VLYDASCGICSRWVPFWSGTLARQDLGFAPLQAEWVTLRVELPEEELVRDLRLLLETGELISGADVYRHVMRRVWWAWPCYVLTLLPGTRQVFDGFYRAFANRRHRLSRTCRLTGELPVRELEEDDPRTGSEGREP